MTWPGRERWLAMITVFGVAEADAWYDRLTSAYSEPHRHYHNQQHIAECLREFDAARAMAERPALVELAIWFHDAVYDPRAGDNEERSAEMAEAFLRGSRASNETREEAKRLVLATKHHVASTPDDALLIDVDLSILGQPATRFAEYEEQIRREYSWVPADVFATRRSEILRRFLDRPRIYATEHFFTHYETRARENLRRSIEQLCHGQS